MTFVSRAAGAAAAARGAAAAAGLEENNAEEHVRGIEKNITMKKHIGKLRRRAMNNVFDRLVGLNG